MEDIPFRKASPLALGGCILSIGALVLQIGVILVSSLNKSSGSSGSYYFYLFFDFMILGFFSVVLCAIALLHIKKDPSIEGKALAKAGLICFGLLFLIGLVSALWLS